MIPYARQCIYKSDVKAVKDALSSDWLTQGPRILEFEKKLAHYCGARYAIAVSNGTVALHAAYLAAGLSHNDEVITSPNTFVATSNMILACDAIPVFCDIRNDTYNINETKISNYITKKTKAIVPVHFAGQSCEMARIKSIAKKNKLIIIEDACHALGAEYRNSKIGSCKYSDMAIFSFHAIKSITTAEGGAILTNNKKLYEKLLLIRSHGMHKDASGKNVMDVFGYNYRITDMQSALGVSQLKKLDGFIKKRNQIVKWYNQALSDVQEIILPQILSGNYISWHIYVIRTHKAEERDKLAEYFLNKDIGTNFHYPAVYKHPYYRKILKGKISCPNMELYHKTCLTLPLHVSLSKKQVLYIAQSIKNFYEKKSNNN
ncbi:MAG: UDP-4-amino-4,6-dideoxy-N-acetyl-beta-L-altrosamine transaminase [Parcubacteria group bacterium CG22_combo_CG10-13_8_21_14_all_41_9]|nr:MAG: UDP-4-amino-4,6-dideoxy-N-acetyl-beta-L-altrosamine transaminase [Parcubacteria group bacterium CG22_combo_CG10-13_8_21_14_all_41_9]